MRIVSLCPSTTESLAALGMGAALVGVTRFCVHPRSVVAGLTKVGGTKDPKLERILALEPDLVVMNREENRLEDHDALVAAGLRVIADMPQRVAEVPGHLRWLGAEVGRSDEGERWALRIESELAHVTVHDGASFRFAYLIWRRPWMAVGPGTYTHDLIALAGGRNVVDGGRYPEVSLETLRKADVVLLASEPYPFSEKHRPELEAALPGVELRFVDGEAYCWHGVRTEAGLRSVRALAQELGARGPG